MIKVIIVKKVMTCDVSPVAMFIRDIIIIFMYLIYMPYLQNQIS